MSWSRYWAFLRYDLRLSGEEAGRLPVNQIFALAVRERARRRWFTSRIFRLMEAVNMSGKRIWIHEVFPDEFNLDD